MNKLLILYTLIVFSSYGCAADKIWIDISRALNDEDVSLTYEANREGRTWECFLYDIGLSWLDLPASILGLPIGRPNTFLNHCKGWSKIEDELYEGKKKKSFTDD